MQADGAAYRCSAADLLQLMHERPDLIQQLSRFGHTLAMQTSQLAACNRLHGVEERLARWLLMSQDRIATDKMPLTQEFLGQMLGTRRSSVSLAASMLQKAGMIRYTRGSVTMLNRRKLEESACECYSIIQDQRKKWEAELA
jgi:CRP-like cAMP-binding protein